MPTYRIDDQGKYIQFEPRKAEELEAELEAALEQNDHVLLAPEPLLYIGRQVTTDLNKAIDLLAVDSRRRVVVVELKKDRTPRDMVAQALEYAAFVRRLDYDALNSIAVTYFSNEGKPWQSLSQAHQESFGEAEETETKAADWNPSQVVILVGQTVQPEIIDVSRYLRDHNIDVRVLQFAHSESSQGERLVNVQTLVGTERMPGEAGKAASQPMPSWEETLAKVPEVQEVFDRLRSEFKNAGLYLRKERTQFSFDLSKEGPPLINMWPSPAGRIIVLVLGARASSRGDLDAFQARVEEMGFHSVRGKSDFSVHVYPQDGDKLGELVASFKDEFLAGEGTPQ